MSTLRSILAMVTAGSVGAVTAVAVTMVLASPSERADTLMPVPSRAASKARTASDRDVRPARDDARLVRLEREVQGLTAELDDDVRPATAQDASQPPVLDGPPPDEAEVVERTRQIWDAQVETHEDAPVDPQWSGEARGSFERGLTEAAGELGGDVRVDCRTDSCLATVEFESYGDATISFSSLLQHDYDLNCETSVAMPPPEDPSAPYGAEVLFVCPDGGRS